MSEEIESGDRLTDVRRGSDGLVDFGMHQITVQGVAFEARMLFPGLTLSDLTVIYEKERRATPKADSYAGNPSLWPTSRAMLAVVRAIHDALYPAEGGPTPKTPA